MAPHRRTPRIEAWESSGTFGTASTIRDVCGARRLNPDVRRREEGAAVALGDPGVDKAVPASSQRPATDPQMPAPTPGETDDGARFASIAAAITCVAVVGIGLSLTIPLLSIEMERMGASSTLIGINTAVAGLAAILTVPFVPRLAARLGVVRLLVLAIATGAACLVAFKLLPGIAWWFALRFVFSTSLGALFVLSEFWINAAAPGAARTRDGHLRHRAGARPRGGSDPADGARHARLRAVSGRGRAVPRRPRAPSPGAGLSPSSAMGPGAPSPPTFASPRRRPSRPSSTAPWRPGASRSCRSTACASATRPRRRRGW